jgi:hypothetical protein
MSVRQRGGWYWLSCVVSHDTTLGIISHLLFLQPAHHTAVISIQVNRSAWEGNMAQTGQGAEPCKRPGRVAP